MNNRTIIWATLFAALLFAVVILALLCFRENDIPPIVEIPAPMQEPEASSITEFESGMATEAVQGIPTPSVHPEETSGSAVMNRLGTLTIRGQDIPIADNVDESTLERSPGWMPDSALPGESGVCVILGHRNRKHLRVLEKIKPGDEITFTYPDGHVATYQVTETTIFENTADWRLPSAVGNTLVLGTCYPFHYIGHAPGKYQVVANLVN